MIVYFFRQRDASDRVRAVVCMFLAIQWAAVPPLPTPSSPLLGHVFQTSHLPVPLSSAPALLPLSSAGCTLVAGGTWPDAPADAYIVGLKELPEDGTPLKHKHIYFAHCFKEQGGWKELLGRFDTGGGHVLDIEFLTNEKNQRVARDPTYCHAGPARAMPPRNSVVEGPFSDVAVQHPPRPVLIYRC